jgi:hypothetical protein
MARIATIKNRIKALWNILTKRNFILIYGIEEFTREDGEPGRRFAWLRRTDYNTESDFYTMKAAMCTQFGMQIMDEDSKIGNYLPKGCEWNDEITPEYLKETGWGFIEKETFTGRPHWKFQSVKDTTGTNYVEIYLELNAGVAKTKYMGGAFSILQREFTSMKKLQNFVKVLISE